MTNFGSPQYGPPPQQPGPPYPPQPQYGPPPQQWAAPAQPFPQPHEQHQYGHQYGRQQVPWGVGPPQQQYDARAQDRKAAVKQMVIGAVVALVGLIITIVTYRAASGGGHYVVAWGPAIFGLIAVVRGAVAYLKA